MRETFRREFASTRPPAPVMADLLDVERVASWVSILSQVAEEQPLSRYRAVLEDRLGPFRLRADLAIDVTVADSSITLQATGTDRQVGSRLTVQGRLDVREDGAGCQVLLAGSYEVSGKAAQLGASSIRRKAAHIVDEFSTNLTRDVLAATPDDRTPDPAAPNSPE
jgi:carbon monoxide dehydrogenase subunit G